MKKTTQDKNIIQELYIDKGYTDKKIGQFLKVSTDVIRQRRKKFNIKGRDPSYKPTKINLYPTQSVGYLCGLILGDGFIFKTKSRNYSIALETTKKGFRDLFKEAFRRAFPNLHCRTFQRLKRRKFPNGSEREDIGYSAQINSKELYQALRPYKQKDYHWTIPKFLNNKISKIGFLKGIYDAEGWVNKRFINNKSEAIVGLGSKHKTNLDQINKLLKCLKLDIKTSIYNLPNKQYSELKIYRRKSKINFQRYINFRLKHKREALMQDLKHFQVQYSLF